MSGEDTGKLTARHLWFERFGLTCCKRCGIVRRRVGLNKPCPGPVRIGLRNRIGADRFEAALSQNKDADHG